MLLNIKIIGGIYMAFNEQSNSNGLGADTTRLDHVVPRQMAKVVNHVATESGTTFQMVLYTILGAILTGDIVIHRSFKNRRNLSIDLHNSPSDLLLTLKNRDGEIINPSKFTDDIDDMFYGIYNLGEDEEYE